VPIALGLTMAARRPRHAPAESFVVKVIRGFPLTVGLALAFIVMFVSVPIIRLISMARRESSADVPLVTDVTAYHEVAGRVVEAMNRHGFGLQASEPSWWVKAPTRILAWFGGAAFTGFVPERLEHYTGSGIEISFYTSGVLLRGKGPRVTWAHGLIAETVVHSQGLQTFAAAAQDVEREIRRLWKVYDTAPEAHAGSRLLLGRVEALAVQLAQLDVEYQEWQVLYRQLLQVERAVRGERQLLDDASTSRKETVMDSHEKAEKKLEPIAPLRPREAGEVKAGPPPESLSTIELIKAITNDVERLVKAQLALAKAEVKADLASEGKMVAGLGVAAVAGLLALNLLFVTAILALATVLPAWVAGLVVSGAVLLVAAIAGIIGWGKRVRHPLARTRHEIQEDVKWTKERMA